MVVRKRKQPTSSSPESTQQVPTKARPPNNAGTRQLAITSLFAPLAVSASTRPDRAVHQSLTTSGDDRSQQVPRCVEKEDIDEAGDCCSSALLWSEEDRPQRLQDLQGNTDSWADVLSWFSYRQQLVLNTVTCLLLVGPPVGKTSAVHALANHFQLPLTEFNMSTQAGPDFVGAHLMPILVAAERQVAVLEDIDALSDQTVIVALERLLARTLTPAKRRAHIAAVKQRRSRETVETLFRPAGPAAADNNRSHINTVGDTVADTARTCSQPSPAASSDVDNRCQRPQQRTPPPDSWLSPAEVLQGLARLNVLVATAATITPELSKISSLCHVVRFQGLALHQMLAIARGALVKRGVVVDSAVLHQCAVSARGDPRSLLTQLQCTASSSSPSASSSPPSASSSPPSASSSPPSASSSSCVVAQRVGNNNSSSCALRIEEHVQWLLCLCVRPSWSGARPPLGPAVVVQHNDDPMWTRAFDVGHDFSRVRCWCFQNYVRAFDFFHHSSTAAPARRRRQRQGRRRPTHASSGGDNKKTSKSRSASTSACVALALLSTIVSDMDIMSCSELPGCSGQRAQREVGAVVGLVRIKRFFSELRHQAYGDADLPPTWLVDVQPPALASMDLWSTRRAGGDDDGPVVDEDQEEEDVEHSAQRRRLAGRLDDLGLLEIADHTEEKNLDGCKATCMWCLAGLEHRTPLCRSLTQFRAHI